MRISNLLLISGCLLLFIALVLSYVGNPNTGSVTFFEGSLFVISMVLNLSVLVVASKMKRVSGDITS